MDIAALYNLYLAYPFVQTDSRKVKPNELFFALKGENFNGNQFALEALEKGAAYAIVDEDGLSNEKIIRVENVLKTLQDLAAYHRSQLNIPFIALTGSNGKTTTKELIAAVLKQKYKTATTKGNLNNHIGIPLTLLSIPLDATIAVIEMGANHQHEIAAYCTYVQPNYGLITNCGKAHIEGFGGIEGVFKAKGELFDYLKAHNGLAFVNNTLPYLLTMSEGIKHVEYGIENGIIMGKIMQAAPLLSFYFSEDEGKNFHHIQTNLVGDYNFPNTLAALAIGKYFGVSAKQMKRAIENYFPTNHRSQLVHKDSNEFIIDAYNANPTSMQMAIQNFLLQPNENKVLILGGMKELGKDSVMEHKNLVEQLQKNEWQQVVLVGKEFAGLSNDYLYFETATTAKEWFERQHFDNTIFLIKGSRSIALEKIIESIF